jgi:hypothetical protein
MVFPFFRIAAALGGTVLLSCVASDRESGSRPSGPVVVSVDGDPPVPGSTTVARYYAKLEPLRGRVSLYRIFPGNVIWPDRQVTALSYDYSGAVTQDNCGSDDCTPAADAVSLFTDQAQITYVDGSGTCYSNLGFCGEPGNAPVPAPGDPCAVPFAFCAPIQVVSRLEFGQTVGAMPDPVLTIAHSSPYPNRVLGCLDSGAASQYGLCAATGPNKVDSVASDLTSPIQGMPGQSSPCAWCYGNAARADAAGKPGLAHTILSNVGVVNAALGAHHTVILAMQLENDEVLDLVLTLRYARPSIDSGPSQLSYDGGASTCVRRDAPTTVTVTGGGFGPPGACLDPVQPPVSCPSSGAPDAAYTLGVPGPAVAPIASSWSDTSITFTAPAATVECPVVVDTPAGTAASSASLSICGDQWRSWTPTLTGSPVERIDAAIGVLSVSGQSYVVIAGGRTSANDGGSEPPADQRTLLLPVPTCQNPRPNYQVASVVGSEHARWGAAAAVVANEMWVVGGAALNTAGDDTICSRTVRVFELTSPGHGRWTTFSAGTPGSLPDMDPTIGLAQGLCHGTLLPISDANGKTWLVLTGGTTRSIPNHGPSNCVGGRLPNPQRTLVLDPANPLAGWTEYTDTGLNQLDRTVTGILRRYGSGGAAVASGLGGLVAGGATSTTSPGTTTASVSTVTVSPSGVPTFTPEADWPEAAYGADVVRVATTLGPFFYALGGASALTPPSCASTDRGEWPGTTAVRRIAESLAGTWIAVAPLPTVRTQAHAVVAAGLGADKIYLVGGVDAQGVPVTQIDEYTP